MRRCVRISILALFLGVVLASPPLEARDFTTKRTAVSKSSRQRSGPTLPSEVEERSTPSTREPTELEQAYEEYYRERAEHYRREREKAQRNHTPGGTCMYGANGRLIYAPPGRDCGSPAAPSR